MKLQSIVTPLTEFDHPEKGDALHGEFLSTGFISSFSISCVCYLRVAKSTVSMHNLQVVT